MMQIGPMGPVRHPAKGARTSSSSVPQTPKASTGSATVPARKTKVKDQSVAGTDHSMKFLDTTRIGISQLEASFPHS